MLRSSEDPLLQIVHAKELQNKTYAYHAHDYREVLTVLGSTENGLLYTEVEKRQKECGANIFTPQTTSGWYERIFTQLRSPIAVVLLIAFALTAALGEYLDATVILFALCIAVVLGMYQEGKASRAFEKLAHSQKQRATVLRNAHKHEIDASELVVGDVVILQSGSQVPADMRLIYTKQLAVNESALTGEWLEVPKNTDAVAVGTPFSEQSCMAWMGSFVARGYGIGVVTAIGDDTAMGVIADSLRGIDDSETPLQSQMRRISNVMLYIIGALVVFIFIIGLWKAQPLEDMLLMAIAIAVASIPEGLPAAVTIILAVGMEALLKRGGLVRNLLAAETLGSTTYVLTDKTGTLTQAVMSVQQVLYGDGRSILAPDFCKRSEARDIFDIALTAVDAYTEEKDDTSVAHGDAVEVAILEAAASVSISDTEGSLRAHRIDYLAFTSEQRFAAGLAEEGDRFRLCVNGAPETLLKHATKMLQGGREEVLYDEARECIEKAIETYTAEGKRLIAVGYKRVSYDVIPENTGTLLDDLVFAGVLVITDPIRKGVSQAIAGVQSAGARVLLVTGDNPQTALSIAREVGIAQEGDLALTGDNLQELSDEDLLIALHDVPVFARVLPSQKMRIAMVLQQKGEIVAMTGDGINDAPALQRAHIGIAIGTGTEVAKEASDLVLMNNSFETIYAAIEEGRRIIANLRKIVGYLLSTSLSEAVLISIALILSAPVPILPAQILWANIIEEGVMSVAFAFEKGEKNAMKQKPQDIHEEGILSAQMLWFVAFVVTVLGLITGVLYLYVRSLALPLEVERSVMFLAIAIDSLFISFSFRSLTVPVWKVPLHTNLFFIGSFLVSATLLVIVLTVPFFQYLLSYTPLPFELMRLSLVAGVLALVTVELGKFLFFEARKN